MHDPWNSFIASARQEPAGLCRTCNHASACRFRAGSSQVIVHCEEFDARQEPDRDGMFAQAAPATALASPPAGVWSGLCVNCDHRECCAAARCEGGVWHCENYQ